MKCGRHLHFIILLFFYPPLQQQQPTNTVTKSTKMEAGKHFRFPISVFFVCQFNISHGNPDNCTVSASTSLCLSQIEREKHVNLDFLINTKR